MTAPFLLIAAPLVLTVIFIPLRRWPQVAGPMAAAVAWLLAIILLGIEVDSGGSGAEGLLSGATWSVYGWTFALSEQTRLLLSTVYVLVGIIFLLSAFYFQSSIFVSVSFFVLSPLSAALMVQPFAYGAVLLLIAAGGLAVIIQGSRAGSTSAALRYLSLTALAVPLLLAAGWMIESDQFRFLDTTTLLLVAALLLLTASFPFQIWVAPVVGESSSLAPSMVYGAAQLLVVVFCLNLLIDQPFAYRSAQFQGIMSLSAAATLILGAALTVTARSFGHLLGYLLLISIGAVTAVIGSLGATVVQITLTLLVLRVIGLIMAGAGLAIIRTRALAVEGGANQFAANQGLAWRTPLGMGLFVFGCLSLAGLPLTPGFAGTWPAVIAVGQQTPWLAFILVLSIAAGAFGVLRRLIPLLARPDEATGQAGSSLEDRKEQVVSAAILIAGAILAFFPRVILTVTGNLADLF